ncbi:MAG: DUF362 domain-containing protein [Elusimicrobia bacterium]|nr:DUF362 domain-containing protein [Candidatus Liberimonas magnetica]
MDKKGFFWEEFIDRILKLQYSRKSFLRISATFLVTLLFSSSNVRKALAKTTEKLPPRTKMIVKTEHDAVVVTGKDPGKITRKAVQTLGGMERFVKKGAAVVVKPNIGWDRTPEYAATTNPEVVSEIVKMCFEAGAKTVKVFDFTCNEAGMSYNNSGIQDAVKKAGGSVSFVDDWKFYPGQFPDGAAMSDWPMYRDAVKCDCFINVPIAKHHSLTRLTLSMKNLMGVCGGSRGSMHWNISDKLVEVTKFIQPDLTIIDAYRILLNHGPRGGNLQDVLKKETVIASADPVLADSYATTLFGLKPEDIECIPIAHKMGLGKMNIKEANIKILTA